MIRNLFQRATSRKFLATVAAYVIVLLSGLGVAEFDREVVAAATVTLLTYIGVEGASDYAGRRNGS